MMQLIIDISLLFVITAAFGYRNGYQFVELRKRIGTQDIFDVDAPTANKRWHAIQFVIQLALGYYAWRTTGLYSAVVVFGAQWWLVFDGIVNKALDKGFWYVGTTAAIDKFVRKLGIPVPFLKIGALLISLTILAYEKGIL